MYELHITQMCMRRAIPLIIELFCAGFFNQFDPDSPEHYGNCNFKIYFPFPMLQQILHCFFKRDLRLPTSLSLEFRAITL